MRKARDHCVLRSTLRSGASSLAQGLEQPERKALALEASDRLAEIRFRLWSPWIPGHDHLMAGSLCLFADVDRVGARFHRNPASLQVPEALTRAGRRCIGGTTETIVFAELEATASPWSGRQREPTQDLAWARSSILNRLLTKDPLNDSFHRFTARFEAAEPI